MNEITDYQKMSKMFEDIGFPVLALDYVTKHHDDDTLKGVLSFSKIEMEIAAKLEGVDLPTDQGISAMFYSGEHKIEYAILIFNKFEDVRSITAFLFNNDGKFVNHTAMSE